MAKNKRRTLPGKRRVHNVDVLFLMDFSPNEPGTIKDLDRRWFEANPGRIFRLREAGRNEFPGATHVLVHQIRKGLRERIPLPSGLSKEELQAVPDSEDVLACLLQALDHPTPGFTVFDLVRARHNAEMVH